MKYYPQFYRDYDFLPLYKYPYETTSISWKVRPFFFFVAQAGWWFHFFNFHPDLWWNDPSWLITHIFQLGGSTTNFSKMIFVIFTHSTPLATLHWPRTSQPPRLGVGPHFHYSVTPKNCQGNKNWWTKQMSFSQFPPIFWTIFCKLLVHARTLGWKDACMWHLGSLRMEGMFCQEKNLPQNGRAFERPNSRHVWR